MEVKELNIQPSTGTTTFNSRGDAWIEPAGFWVRLAAYLVDILFLNTLTVAMTRPLQLKIQPLLQSLQNGVRADDITSLLPLYQKSMPILLSISLIYSIASLVYFVGFNGRFGHTPGKWLLGLRIVTDTGEPITYGRAFARYGAELLSLLILGIGYLMIAMNPQKKGLHDQLAGTRVVHSR